MNYKIYYLGNEEGFMAYPEGAKGGGFINKKSTKFIGNIVSSEDNIQGILDVLQKASKKEHKIWNHKSYGGLYLIFKEEFKNLMRTCYFNQNIKDDKEEIHKKFVKTIKEFLSKKNKEFLQ